MLVSVSSLAGAVSISPASTFLLGHTLEVAGDSLNPYHPPGRPRQSFFPCWVQVWLLQEFEEWTSERKIFSLAFFIFLCFFNKFEKLSIFTFFEKQRLPGDHSACNKHHTFPWDKKLSMLSFLCSKNSSHVFRSQKWQTGNPFCGVYNSFCLELFHWTWSS